MNNCAICAKEISPRSKFCKDPHEKSCEVCGKSFIIKSPYSYEKTRVCSKSCGGVLSHTPDSKAKRLANSLERYGVEAPQQRPEVKLKAQRTNEARYGAKWPNQNNAVREKAYQTNERRYGVRHPLQSEELKLKAAESLERTHGVRHPSRSGELRAKAGDKLEERFGVRHSFQSEAVKRKIRETYRSKYGVDYPSQVPEIREKILESYARTVALGGGKNRVSKINLRWKELLEDRFRLEVRLEHPLGGKSFDLYIPEKRLLLEVNPTVTHNSELAYACVFNGCSTPCDRHKPLAKDHHQKRAKLAKANGLSLVQIYDWDDEESILRMLSGKLESGFSKKSARKLKLKKIEATEANLFLGLNHIQGGVRGQAHCYGLFDGDELLAVATFGKARFGNSASHEWLRYAVKAGYIIHGAANRLFEEFLKEVNPESVVSYVNFDHSTAPRLFLSSSGFQELATTGPGLVWSKGTESVQQTSLMRLGADRLLKTSYGSREESGLDNQAIMLLEGWLPVYTAGNRVFAFSEIS